MHIFSLETPFSENQSIRSSIIDKAEITLDIKREDRIHEIISGNKYRKLKYNFFEAKKRGYDRVLTFGGAYSNHIAATAAAGKILGIETVGVIRGEELGRNLPKTLSENETLRAAALSGMVFKFVDRTAYREKENTWFIDKLLKEFGDCYIIPEGGTNVLAIQGCEEILNDDDSHYDYICCPVGTGGTIVGIINSTNSSQKVLGFPALKGNFIANSIEKYTSRQNWKLITEYHFGGYAKIDQNLITFINNFRTEQHIRLDPVYTGKMIFGIFDLIKKGFFSKNTRILAIHTGGLQGISGMNKKLKKKKLPLITG